MPQTKENAKSRFYGHWFQEFSSIMSVMIPIHEVECNLHLTTDSHKGSDQRWKLSRKKKLRRITIHVTYNKTLTGPINSNCISSMSRMISILHLSGALSQTKRPNHSQSGWFCIRAFFFKGRYLHPRSRNLVSEKITHGHGECWCVLFCS